MKKRYIVLIGVLTAQLTIAGIYAWSVFAASLEIQRGWSSSEVLLPYALAQFVFALTTIFSGRIVDNFGPKLPLLLGAIFYGSGIALSYFATAPWILYLTYGVLSGIGVGLVYVCPLATLTKWFPEKKGIITGLSVAVFGGGSILFQRVILSLLEHYSIADTFLRLGIISFGLILVGAMLTDNPPNYKKAEVNKQSGDFLTHEMIKTPTFKILWVMFLMAVIPGLLILGAAKNIGIDVTGLSPAVAAGIISILAFSNASSRLVSGGLSDRIGTVKVLQIAFVINIISLLLLGFLGHILTFFYIGMIGVAVAYGGFLALFPIFTNKVFGAYRFGSNYGVVFQAYGLAALIGIFMKDLLGSYTNTFILSAILASIGLFLSLKLSALSKENIV